MIYGIIAWFIVSLWFSIAACASESRCGAAANAALAFFFLWWLIVPAKVVFHFVFKEK